MTRAFSPTKRIERDASLARLNAKPITPCNGNHARDAAVVAEPTPEKSWTDVVNESVVTSSELKQLELKPRKKLLGDWFCEGDLGFIFAFRGTGKTWLALAMAKTLETGSKLGDWQAHEPVKVLYIDGEMPPDLIRDRCTGLESGVKEKT